MVCRRPRLGRKGAEHGDYRRLTGQYLVKGLFSDGGLILQPSSDSFFSRSQKPFPFCFFSFLVRPVCFSSQGSLEEKVCSRGGGVLSVVAGFVPILGSSNGKRPVVNRTVAASRSRRPASNGEGSIRITFAAPMSTKRKSTERAPNTSAATASSIPTTCGATRLPSENVVSG